ncbi:MAG: hypothetical protein ABL953_00100 [Ilumatobacteraceae bacterium]
MTSAWMVRDSVGDAGEFHSVDAQPLRSATFHMVATRTLVLGSAQRNTDVDHRVATSLGTSVVRRRSGGGAVLLVPGEFVWLDLVIAANDPLWVDDVGQAMEWVGELWQRALSDVEMATDVNRVGGGSDQQWSRQVCFAGIGRGEVVQGDRKVVGVSQRRARNAARFQSMCHLRWRPELVAALVATPRPMASELADRVAVVSVPAAALRDSLIRHLPNR